MIVRALTLKQPWASAVVFGPKRIENRTWRGPVGERIAIHAGASWDVAREQLCFDAGFGLRVPDKVTAELVRQGAIDRGVA